MTALIVLIVGCALLGFATARWWTVAVAVGAILLFYIGLDSAWWGSGTGDSWQYAMIFMAALSGPVTSAAVLARRARRG